MRVKQTARKSTGPRVDNDPMRSRQRVLETKRSSLGQAASVYLQQQNASTSRQNLPMPRRIGNNGRGKQLPLNDGEVKFRPKTKARSGIGVLKEIKHLQATTSLCIPKAAFHRVVREITQSVDSDPNHPIRYQMAAIQALQEAAEAYLVRLFEDAYLLSIHAKRVTLFTKDIELCRRLRRE